MSKLMKVKCERDGHEFTAEPKPYMKRKTNFYTTKDHGDLLINCPKCGRGYFIEDDGIFRADRPLTIL